MSELVSWQQFIINLAAMDSSVESVVTLSSGFLYARNDPETMRRLWEWRDAWFSTGRADSIAEYHARAAALDPAYQPQDAPPPQWSNPAGLFSQEGGK